MANKSRAILEAISIARELRIRKCRLNFWYYCQTMNPKFYKDDRVYLKTICDTFQALYEGRIIKYNNSDEWIIVSQLPPIPTINYDVCKNMQLNMPPGFGKSYTAVLFGQWLFGVNTDNELITVSYNEKLSERFGKTIRDGIEEKKDITNAEISYSDIFPDTKIKYGDSSKSNWAIEGRHHSYLSTSFTGTMTGMRCNFLIIDDPVKSAEVANNEAELEEQWIWYKDTCLSRVIEGGIQLVIQTRWSTKDLCGRLLNHKASDWYVLLYEVYDEENDILLCPELMSMKTYKDKRELTSPEIFRANYHQQPVDIKGRLYTRLLSYTLLPEKFEKIISYCDTADEGKDALCLFIVGVLNGEGYVLDILHTRESMEVTEDLVADMLFKYKPEINKIESNNGGAGFARNVTKRLWERHKTRNINIKAFHQSGNKMSRILTSSSFVANHLYFPNGWEKKFKSAYDEMITFQRDSKNKFDDVEDVAAGIYEMIEKGPISSGVIKVNI